MNTLGLNVLAQTAHDRLALNEWIARLNSRAILIMDDVAQAQDVARRYPTMAVVHRAWRADDAHLHIHAAPADWLRSVEGHGRNNVIVQCLNEPDGYRNVAALVLWCVETMRLAAARGVRLALPNFAVGHPDYAAIDAGAFDALLRAFVRYPMHVLAVHEYFVSSAAQEPDHIGRFRRLLQRADTLRLERPIVLVTEAGRDVGGGPKDGWRDTGWTEAAYAERLREMAAVQARLGAVGACVFGYGAGFGGRWASFDVAGADGVLSEMAQWNVKVAGVTRRVRSPVRVRQLPTTASPTVRVLLPGAAVAVVGAGTRREGWTWLPLVGGGWIAAEAARL